MPHEWMRIVAILTIGLASRITDCYFLFPQGCSGTVKNRRKNVGTVLMKNRTYSRNSGHEMGSNGCSKSNGVCESLPTSRGTTNRAGSRDSRRRPRGNSTQHFFRTTSRDRTSSGQATRGDAADCNFRTNKERTTTQTGSRSEGCDVATWTGSSAAFFKRRHTRVTWLSTSGSPKTRE